MGTKMAPAYANILMSFLEGKLLEASTLKPLFFARYIDDIFIIWPHGHDSLQEFFQLANNFHQSIKFTHDQSTEEVPFSDVKVIIKDNKLSTSLHWKPTDTQAYLRYNSFHPTHLKDSLVYSQALRLKRICSEDFDYSEPLTRLAGQFLSRGYPLSIIMKQFSRASKIDRPSLLTYKAKPQPHSRVPLVTKFHPSIPTLHKHVKESWQILKQDPKLGEMCLQPPIAATRQPANLRALLVHTKLSRKENFGNTPCGKARCQVCDHMMVDQSLNLTHSKCTIRPGRFNCDSENVTYILICSKCPEGIYVGETGTKFRLRFNNHSFSIRKNLKGFPVATHLTGLTTPFSTSSLQLSQEISNRTTTGKLLR